MNLEDTTKILVSMAKYVKVLADSGLDNILALELVNEPW
jgi:hypothetical protein